MANGGPITPGREPENIKKLLDVFLADLDEAFPDGVVVWSEWNHEKWDKAAGFLCKNLGYTKGAEFLQAYGFEIVQERKPEPKPDNKKEKEQKSKEKPVNKSAKQWEDEDYKPRKKKNHTLLIVSIVVLILALMAVGIALFITNRSNNGEAILPISAPKKSEDGPEKTVSQFCDAMKAFDLEKMHSLVIEDGEALLDTSDDMAQTFMDSLKEWAGKLSCNITDTALNGDKADVTVKFKYTDATNLIKNTLAEYMTQAFAMVFDNPSEDELHSLLGKVFQEQKGKITVGTAEASVVFPCSKTADGWKLDHVSDEALNVLTGNMMKVFDEVSELNFDETSSNPSVNSSIQVTDTTEKSVNTQPISNKSDISNNIYKVGEKAETNTIAMTMTSVKESTGDSYSKPRDGKTFLICEFEIENKNTKDLDISSSINFTGYCDGYAVETKLLTTEEPKPLMISLAPGKKIIGSVSFEVPEDWKEIEVHYKEDVIVYAFQDNNVEDIVFIGYHLS